jgi:mono/diheme cytochrome c family protein
MKRIITIAKYMVSIIIIGIIGLVFYVRYILPDVGNPEKISIESTAERIARGKYLANSVCVCMDCHSTRDWNKFSGPLVAGTLGKGGEKFDQKFGFPGIYYAKNITPFNLKDWTDGEILRAITSGVNNKGKALFPVMPHPNYGKLDKDDLFSIIAYLRSLDPVENMVPESESDFPMNFIINLIPKKAAFTNIPDENDRVAYGAYLFTASACNDCHTQQIKGKQVAGMELAGGFRFPLLNGGLVRSANITSDKETGIGNWAEEDFVNRFKEFADSTYLPEEIQKGEFNTVMPWTMYGTMKEDDLKAIYAYLRTVKPIKNKVKRFTAKESE